MAGRELGDIGENLGREILSREGYRIIAAKYRYARGEIDLIGWEGDLLAFIEIKTRRRGNFGTPAEAVDKYKCQRLIGAARHFLYTRRIQDQQCRFDVLSIYADAQGRLLKYSLLRNAFEVKGGNYY